MKPQDAWERANEAIDKAVNSAKRLTVHGLKAVRRSEAAILVQAEGNNGNGTHTGSCAEAIAKALEATERKRVK